MRTIASGPPARSPESNAPVPASLRARLALALAGGKAAATASRVLGIGGTEGARYREVYATYLHGPVLPKNPWLADILLARAIAHRYPNFGPLAPLPDEAEGQAHAAALSLARRQAGRRRAVADAVSRIGRSWRTPTTADGKAGIAGKETGWTSH